MSTIKSSLVLFNISIALTNIASPLQGVELYSILILSVFCFSTGSNA
jgi:hypothetical protein